MGELAEREGRMPEAVDLMTRALRRFEAIDSMLDAARTAEALGALTRASAALAEARTRPGASRADVPPGRSG